MDLHELNDPVLLDNTPIGRLRVVPWAGQLAVAIMNKHEPERVEKVIHMLDHRGPLAALYGKRFWEQKSVRAIYDQQHERNLEGVQRGIDTHRKDFRSEVARIFRRDSDGVLEFVGGKR